MTHSSLDNALAARVQRLESLEAIRTLVQQYSLCVDDHDFDGIAQCFARRSRYRSVDGLIDVSDREPIRDYFAHRMAALGPTCHVTHDHVMQIDPANLDQASGRLTSHAEVVVDGVPMFTCLRYADRYVLEDARWRFRERVMHFLYYCSLEEYPRILASRRRKVMAGKHRDADIPEGLPGWRGQKPT